MPKNSPKCLETGLAAVAGSMVVCGAVVVKGLGRSVSTSPTLVVECVDDVLMNSQVLRATPHTVEFVPSAPGHELTTEMVVDIRSQSKAVEPVPADSF